MESVEPMDTGGEASPGTVDQAHSSGKPEVTLTTQEPDSTTSTFTTLQPVQAQQVSTNSHHSVEAQVVLTHPQSVQHGQVITSLHPVLTEHITAGPQPIQAGHITTTQISVCTDPKNTPQQCDNEMVLGQSGQKWEVLGQSGQTWECQTVVYAASPMATDSGAVGTDYSPVHSPSTAQQDCVKCEPKIGCVKSESMQCKASCSAPFLPPCKVCGDRASGFHYGVNTCEPCKGFFRRSIVKIEHHKEGYRCSMSGKCSLGPGTRHACSACRYNKCLEVGMSKEAIKTGRYTYEKRTKITQEVKKLERLEKGCQEMAVKEEDSEHIIRELVAVQRRINPTLAEYFDGNHEALNEQAAVFEAYMKRIEMFGSMSVLPVEVYQEFSKEAGIDVENRQELMKHIVERMETCITNMVEYVRSVPELKDLTLEDQTALVKASHFEFGFLCMFHGIRTELNVTGDCNTGIHTDDTDKDKTFQDDLFQCAKTFKCLKLTEEEVALTRGIVITFSDRCVLQEPERVEQIQWRLINCLRYFARRRGINPDQRLSQILDRLTALRSISEMCRKLDKEKAKWSAFKDHPLVLDVITS